MNITYKIDDEQTREIELQRHLTRIQKEACRDEAGNVEYDIVYKQLPWHNKARIYDLILQN